MQLFEMSPITTTSLKTSLTVYHGLFRQNKCEAKEMEELVASALKIDPIYTDKVEWKSGSHEPGSDIIIPNIKLSIKSGTIKDETITISGNRLTKAKENFNIINSLLKSYVSDVMICFVYEKKDDTYQVIYVDSDVFIYPELASDWKNVMSKKSGNTTAWTWTPPNDMLVKITPSMSWQVWWHIPLKICRMGSLITTRK